MPARKTQSGTIQNDVLKEFMVRNTYIYPPAGRRCGSSPTSSPTPPSGCRGSTRSQHLRLPHAGGRGDGRPGAGLHPRRRAVLPPGRAWRRGSTSTPSRPRLSFFWAVGMNFFMEVAKLRAARLLWARLAGAVRGAGPQIAGVARALPDLRLVADGAGSLQQRRPDVAGGHGRRPTAAPRACTPTPSTRPWACRPTSPPGSPATPSCTCCTRPASPARSTPGAGQLPPRAAHARAGDARDGAHRGGRGAGRDGPRRSSRACRSCASRRPRPAPRPGSTAPGRPSSGSTATASTTRP